MPPKVPNLKFKPKLVSAASKQPTTTPVSGSEWQDLSLLQLERLHRLSTDELSTKAESQAQSSSHPVSSTNVVGSFASESSPTGTTGAVARRAAGLPRPPQSTHAALQEACNRYVDLSAYPEQAEVMPPNTLQAHLTENRAAEYGQPTVYPPIALDSVEACRTSSLSTGQSGHSAAAQPDGTAFLREGDEELKRAFQTNQDFVAHTLAANSHSSEFDMHTSDGHLVWMQLPRFHTNGPSPFVLKDMPPGKVGELRVLKSGRMVMSIGGVCYDVWVEDAARDLDGACATVAVTQPSPYPMDPNSKAQCYQVGTLEKKLVCVPTIQQ